MIGLLCAPAAQASALFGASDIGIASFEAEPLAIDGDTLALRRHDGAIRYEKVDD